MSGRHGVRPYPETRFASRDRKRAVSAPHTPRQNHLLAALPQEDYERLLPDLEPVPLPLGWTVHGAGDREKYLYFLTAGIVSRFYVTENGASAEFAVTGSEGVIGVASFLGGESTPSQAVVLSAGYAYRLGADLLKQRVRARRPAAAFAAALHPGADRANRADRGVQPAPFAGTATVPLDPVVPGPVALERADDDAGADRRYAGRAPRRRHGGRSESCKRRD